VEKGDVPGEWYAATQPFSGGGTGTYNVLPRAGGVTDVQVGSYIFMDCQYLEIGGESSDGVQRL
jgi:D-serine deaminase-like pyridoxal phosphate-dependent protein